MKRPDTNQNRKVDMMAGICVGQARAPEGTRLYAIGDVHGCLDQLKALHQIIADDLTLRPVTHHTIIHLGDYVDRGPDSCGSIQFLIDLMAENSNTLCLKGNHEDKLFDFIKDPVQMVRSFLTYGGVELSASYGIKPARISSPEDEIIAFRDALQGAIPPQHLTFMQNLPTSYQAGDYLFVHAGVRPDTPLNEQSERDLMWIRSDFLNHTKPLAKIIVHGHTPNISPEIKRNRINVDTLAYDTKNLTCVVLEEDKHTFLSTRD